MGGVYTDEQGRKRPIRGKGGGSRPAVVVAVVFAGVVAVGGVGGAAGGAATGGVGAEAGAVQSVQVGRAVRGGRQAASRGDRDGAWRRVGFRNTRRTLERAADCAVHSYGQVREFLIRTPCRGLDRMLFLVADDSGGAAVVAVAWVRMGGSRQARELRALADRYGTGNVSPIGMAALELAGVPFTGRYYDSRPQGSTVVISEVEPVQGQPDPAVLKGLAQVAVWMPRP